jgi:hypothetical protein
LDPPAGSTPESPIGYTLPILEWTFYLTEKDFTMTTFPASTIVTSNADEHSLTVNRENGVKLDFCAYRSDKALIIGATDGDGNPLQEVMLSAQESSFLLDHLLDSQTQAALS